MDEQRQAVAGVRERVEIRKTIARAWRICYGNPRLYLGMAAVVALPPFIMMLLNMAVERDFGKAMKDPAQGFIGLIALALGIAAFVLAIYFAGGITVLTAYEMDERPLGWTDAFSWIRDRNLFWPVALVILLAGLAALGGLILLIVPGIIFGTWFMLCIPARVLGNHRGRAALSESRRLVRPVFRGALGFGLLLMVPPVVLGGGTQGICAGIWGLMGTSPARILPPAIIIYLVSVLWMPVAGVALNIFYVERAGGLAALRDDLFL